MIFQKFINETESYWVKYFEWATVQIREGKITSDAGKIIFPNIILFTKCDGFYVAEFFGASERFVGFSSKEHKATSILKYFGQFDANDSDPLITLDGANHGLIGISLSRGSHAAEVEERFPVLKQYWSGVRATFGEGAMLGFGKNFTSAFLQNCIFINKKDDVYRCKYIASTFVVKSSIDKAELHELFLGGPSKQPVNMLYSIAANYTNSFIASQFQNIYLFPNMLEVRIGDFINLHPEIIKRAFNSEHFLYEPYLEWIEHDGTCNDTAINPDLLVRRSDGYYDIYDLKTALLNKKKITRKGRSRRSFIEVVSDGIVQLANYREYFQYPKNADFAKNKYGIEISNPKLVLIVGSWENFDVNEVNQAMRQYAKQPIEIIDYDTLCQMFRMA